MKIKLKIPSINKVKPIKLLRLLPKLTLVILLISFGCSIYFLYRYFYQTVAQVKVVSILRNQVALNQVNVPLYQKVLSAWESKKLFDVSTLDNLKDPFQPLIKTSSTSETPTIEQVNSTE